jgi:Phage Terminase
MSARYYSIDKVLQDKTLLGAALGPVEPTWSTWRTVLKAAYGLKLDEEELRVFASVAGDRAPPSSRVRELWCVAGRRGGKSRIAAALACYVALFVKHKLSPGERGMCLVLAASLDQAKSVFNYCLAFLQASPVLCKEIVDHTQSEIRLHNGVVIACHANSFRSIRGRTVLCCVFDEVSFWRDDSTATPDSEVYSAVLPSLATCNGLLVGISSPYRKVGLLHQKYKAYFGVGGDDVLVVQGGSQMFNPSLTDEIINQQKLADPTAASSEWDARFRADLTGLYDDATIDRGVDRNRPLELPPMSVPAYYRAGVDPSGGAPGGDAYSICISHKEGDDRYVVDVVRGRQGPFDPKEVTEEYAKLCREYRITSVTGDLYGHQWVQQAWRDCGMTYVVADQNASMIYLETLPLFTRGLVSLPDHPALLRELRLLERIPGRIGRDQVTHPRNAHDDLANALCICLRGLANYLGYDLTNPGLWDEAPNDPEAEAAAWRVMRFKAHLRSCGVVI